ncbi:MAG: hypothetical protein GY737_23715, partial [Desulfobacteraceae bacterium]|nr:hypothetical protein [Desulfobacteraceae bacterium]
CRSKNDQEKTATVQEEYYAADWDAEHLLSAELLDESQKKTRSSDDQDELKASYADAVKSRRRPVDKTTSAAPWVIDSGATEHMASGETKIYDYVPLGQPKIVRLSSGHVLRAMGRGRVRLVARIDQNKATTTLDVTDVLVVPGLRFNLLSVQKVTNKGKQIIFDHGACRIYDNLGKTIAVGRRLNGLYYLEATN